MENAEEGDLEDMDRDYEEIDVPLISSKSVSRHNSNYDTQYGMGHSGHSSRRSRSERATDIFSLSVSYTEFGNVCDIFNVSEPLNENALAAVFTALLRLVKKKIDFQWKEKHSRVNVAILERFWAAQTNAQQMERARRKWSSNLKEKVPSGLFPINVALTAFNQSIVRSINEKLGHIVKTRKRQSTVDQRQAPRMQQKAYQHQPMQMDLDQ